MARIAHRFLAVVAALTALAGCARDPEAPSLGELRTMEDAARAGERAFGVPGDLVLAIAWSETRWTIAEDGPESHGDHVPRSIGVAGIRPDAERLAHAAEALGVDVDRIDQDPIAGVLAASYLLRELALARGPLPADLGGWHEVVADFAGLDVEAARRAHVDAVYAVLRDGVEADAVDGSHIVLHSREVTISRELGVAAEYGGSEYSGADWVAASSENYTSGRGGHSVRYIVIHTMQGSYSGSISWFRNPSASVSAHFCVRSSDGAITQMVHEGDTAWHAGNWTYNQESIGIEHEGYVADPGRWYTAAMYESSARLVRHLATKYGIPMDRSHIIGHYEVPGATHTDPGSGWDWDRFMSLVRGEADRPEYAATFTGQDHPAEMTSGDRAVAWVEYRNDGRATWSTDRTRLGTTSPDDHASPFFDAENWMNDHRASGADHSDYGTGATGRFTFMITAPEVTEDTTITDTFRVVEEGVAWFGDPTTLSVVVHPRAASVPADDDGDGSPVGTDCDDASPDVHPGADDVCEDGIDQDCDGADAVCGEASDGGAIVRDGGLGGGPDGAGRPHVDGCSVAAPGAGAAGASSALSTIVLALLGITIARRRRVR